MVKSASRNKVLKSAIKAGDKSHPCHGITSVPTRSRVPREEPVKKEDR